jgi:hypothetical protein
MKIVITVDVPDGAAVSVDVPESEPVAPAKPPKAKKAVTAPEPAQPAATPAPEATAPATQPAQSPAVPTLSKEKLNKAVLAVAGVNRQKAIEILGKYGVANTATLPVEKYQAVFDDFEEEKARLDAAAAQASLV